MRDRIKHGMNGVNAGAARICRWSHRHAVLLALALLLSTIVLPRKVQGQSAESLLCSPCGGAGNYQCHAWQRDCRRPAGHQHDPEQHQ